MNMNGISTALVHLATTSCALESARPGLAEVKAAKVSATGTEGGVE